MVPCFFFCKDTLHLKFILVFYRCKFLQCLPKFLKEILSIEVNIYMPWNWCSRVFLVLYLLKELTVLFGRYLTSRKGNSVAGVLCDTYFLKSGLLWTWANSQDIFYIDMASTSCSFLCHRLLVALMSSLLCWSFGHHLDVNDVAFYAYS